MLSGKKTYIGAGAMIIYNLAILLDCCEGDKTQAINNIILGISIIFGRQAITKTS